MLRYTYIYYGVYTSVKPFDPYPQNFVGELHGWRAHRSRKF